MPSRSLQVTTATARAVVSAPNTRPIYLPNGPAAFSRGRPAPHYRSYVSDLPRSLPDWSQWIMSSRDACLCERDPPHRPPWGNLRLPKLRVREGNTFASGPA